MERVVGLISVLVLFLGGCGEPVVDSPEFETTLIDNIAKGVLRYGPPFAGDFVGAAADSSIVFISMWTVTEKVNQTDRIADSKTLYLFVDAGSTMKADGVTPYQDGEVFTTLTVSDTIWTTIDGFDSDKRMIVEFLSDLEPPTVYEAVDPTLPPESSLWTWHPKEGQHNGSAPDPCCEIFGCTDPSPCRNELLFCPEGSFSQESMDLIEGARDLPDGAPAEFKGWCASPLDDWP